MKVDSIVTNKKGEKGRAVMVIEASKLCWVRWDKDPRVLELRQFSELKEDAENE